VAKSPNAFRTISEVASWLNTQSHVLRFWESKFKAVAPVQRAGGRRYYRKTDMLLLGGIKFLLHERGMTIKAVQRLLKDEGTAHVQSYSSKINLIESSSFSKKRLADTIYSNLGKPIEPLNGFHAKKVAQTTSNSQSEPSEHKDQPLLFPELQLGAELEEEMAIKPSETTIATKPTPPPVYGAGLSKTDPKLTEFLGKIGPVTQILKLSVIKQSHLVGENAHIITQLQNLQNKLSA